MHRALPGSQQSWEGTRVGGPGAPPRGGAPPSPPALPAPQPPGPGHRPPPPPPPGPCACLGWLTLASPPRCAWLQGNGYDERVMVIYDGLHYDALAVGAFQVGAAAPEGAGQGSGRTSGI